MSSVGIVLNPTPDEPGMAAQRVASVKTCKMRLGPVRVAEARTDVFDGEDGDFSATFLKIWSSSGEASWPIGFFQAKSAAIWARAAVEFGLFRVERDLV